MKNALVILIAVVLVAGYIFRERVVPLAPEWVQAYAARIDPALAPKAAVSATDGAKGNATAGGQSRNGRTGGPTAVTVAEAAAGTLPILRTTIGTVVAAQSTQVAAQVAGRIVAVQATDGSDVKAGDLLAQLDDSTIRAQIAKDQAQIAKDQAALASAQDTFNRTERLVATGVATAQTGDDAKSALSVAQGTLEVDKAAHALDEVALGNTQIRAPFAGRLGAVQLSVGAYVSAGTAIVRITQMKPVLVQFALPVTDLALLRQTFADAALKVAVSPSLGQSDGSPKETGQVTFLDNAVDAASATLTLRASLPNDDLALWPGQPVSVDVQAGDSGPVVLVPTVAIVQQSNGTAVFVAKDDGTVENRAVTVALMVGQTAGISKGLAAGEKVVTEGQSSLTDGAKIKIVDPAAKSGATSGATSGAKAGADEGAAGKDAAGKDAGTTGQGAPGSQKSTDDGAAAGSKT